MLLLAAFFAGVLAIIFGLVVLSGVFPAINRPDWARTALANILIHLCMAGIGLIGAMSYMIASYTLPTAESIIAGGVAILAGPLLFQRLPAKFRDSIQSLVVLAAVLSVVGGVLWLLGWA